MSDKAHKQTDKKLLKMEQHIKDIYQQAEGDMRAKWEEFMENAEKRTTKLREQLQAALESNDPKEIQEARAALQQRLQYVTFRNEQYKQMVEQMAANYEHANEISLAYINGKLPEVYALNYNYIGKGIATDVGKFTSGYTFTLVDQNTVKYLATQDKSLLPTKKVNVPKDLRWNTKQINAQVMQGILQGESMHKIAARLQTVTDMTSAAAIRNARTMVTGAENAGRMQGAENAIKKGVLVKKRWLSTHDERTRDWHTALNGKEAENDEPFENDYGKIMYPGDPSAHPANVYNCRCTLTYKVVGFRKSNGETTYTGENSELTEQGQSSIIKSEQKPIEYKQFNSGEEVNDFFYYDDEKRGLLAKKNSTHGKWLDGLSKDEKEAISWYTADGYGDINDYWRKRSGWEDISKDIVEEASADIDRAISRFNLKENITVQRGVEDFYGTSIIEKEPWNDIHEIIGKTFQDLGYSSATVLSGNSVATTKPILFEIDIPAGSGRGAYVNKLAGQYEDVEYEFLISRGSKFAITDVITNEEVIPTQTIIKMRMIVDE